MDVSLAVLADYANVSREGKLNVMGIFDRIHARQLPGQFPLMQLVIRLDARHHELGREHTVQVQLLDPDGDVIFDINGSFTPDAGEPRGGASLNHIIGLANLPLRKAGAHSVVIRVDDDVKREIPLEVVQAPPDPAQAFLFEPGGTPTVH